MELVTHQNLRSSIVKKINSPTSLALLLMIVFSLVTFKFWLTNPNHLFQFDVDQYYSYLVAGFIHHDFSFHFDHQLWLIETPIGTRIPKVTMGMAMLYFPFFLIAKIIAFLFGYNQMGYSSPFSYCIHFGSMIYVIIGFWFTRKTLLLYFSEWVSAITMLLILFTTNLFYYTYREGEMPHSYLFFLFSIFLYHTIKWHFTKKIKHFYYFSFIAGLITLIRPTEIFILIIPLLFQITTLQELLLKFKLVVSLKWKLVIAASLFLAPIIPQLIFWKIHAGQFLFFSYGSNEGFFFLDPKIYSVLLGWHKGWFIYTPLAILMIIGLMMMFVKWKKMAIPIAVYLALTIYTISSWWDWGFGGAFGMRALVQSYALLVIPIAFFIQWLFSLSNLKFKIPIITLMASICLFFTVLNIFQTWQTRHIMFHWDSMTRKAYSFTFLKAKYSPEEREYLKTLFIHPNYEAMRKGDRDEK